MKKILLIVLVCSLALPVGVKSLILSELNIGGIITIIILLFSYLFLSKWKMPHAKKYFIFLLIVFCINTFSTDFNESVRSQVKSFSYTLIYTALLLIIVYDLSFTYSQEYLLEQLSKAIIFSTFATAVIGMLQYIALLPFFEKANGLGMLGHKNHYGYNVAIGFIVSCYHFVKKKKFSYFFIAFFLLLAVSMSFSRGALIGSLIPLGILIYSKSKRVITIFFSIIFACSLLFTLSILYKERLNQEDVTSGRIELWLFFLPNNGKDLIWGKGAGSAFLISSFDINEYGGYTSGNNEHVYSHNDFLFLLHDYGLLIAILYVFIIISGIKYVFKNIRGDDKFLFLSLYFLLIVYQLVDTCFFGSYNFPLLFFACLFPVFSKFNSYEDYNSYSII